MERGEGGSHYQHTQDRRRDLYILYNIQPFYGSSTFMAHYDYEWSLTPHRAVTRNGCFWTHVLFSFLAPSGAQGVVISICLSQSMVSRTLHWLNSLSCCLCILFSNPSFSHFSLFFIGQMEPKILYPCPVLSRALVSFVTRYSGWWERGITGHTEHNCDLLELGPKSWSRLRTVLQPICLLLTKIAYRYSQGRGTGLPCTNATKKRWCNYSMFCSIL